MESDIQVRKEYFEKWQIWWHPYTCCDHVSMEYGEGNIVCPKCGRTQALPEFPKEQRQMMDRHIEYVEKTFNRKANKIQ